MLPYSYIRSIDSPERYYRVKAILARNPRTPSPPPPLRQTALAGYLPEDEPRLLPLAHFHRKSRSRRREHSVRSPAQKLPGISFERMGGRGSMQRRENCLSERHFNNFEEGGGSGRSPDLGRMRGREERARAQSREPDYEVNRVYQKYKFDNAQFKCLFTLREGAPRF